MSSRSGLVRTLFRFWIKDLKSTGFISGREDGWGMIEGVNKNRLVIASAREFSSSEKWEIFDECLLCWDIEEFEMFGREGFDDRDFGVNENMRNFGSELLNCKSEYLFIILFV